MKSQFPDLALLGWSLTGDFGGLTAYTTEKGKVVMFPRAPPLNPPSDAQQLQRDRLTEAANEWALFPLGTQQKWQQAARRASLRITGYNLWVYWHMSGDTATVATVSHQTGIDLVSTLPP